MVKITNKKVSAERLDKKESLILKSIAKLESYFPNAFNYEDPRPLDQSVKEELLGLIKDGKIEFFNRELTRALKYYKRAPQYVASYKSFGRFIDLQGNETTKISEKDIKYSLDVLANRPQITFRVLKPDIPFKLPKGLKKKYQSKLDKWSKQRDEVIFKINELANKDPESLTKTDLNKFGQWKLRVETLDNNLKMSSKDFYIRHQK